MQEDSTSNLIAHTNLQKQQLNLTKTTTTVNSSSSTTNNSNSSSPLSPTTSNSTSVGSGEGESSGYLSPDSSTMAESLIIESSESSERGMSTNNKNHFGSPERIDQSHVKIIPGAENHKMQGIDNDTSAIEEEEEGTIEAVPITKSNSSNQINIDSLSVQESSIPSTSSSSSTSLTNKSGRIRRASTLSEASSSAILIPEEGSSSSSNTNNDKPAKRKVARTDKMESGSNSDTPMNEGSTSKLLTTKTTDLPSPSSPKRKSSIPFSTTLSHDNLPSPLPHPSASSSSTSSTPPVPHVDIVSYPSNDLLRLLASLLEQIATANDALNQRILSGTSNSRSRSRDVSLSGPSSSSHHHSSNSNSAGGGEDRGDEERELWEKGRFDAAPLNSPVTPRYTRNNSIGGAGRRVRSSTGGAGGGGVNGGIGEENEDEENQEGFYDSTLGLGVGASGSMMDYVNEGVEDEEEEEEDELPVTPGIDLQREVGIGGGVEGFMPSLGGAHTPMPLARRRGSSFLTNKQRTGMNLDESNAMRRGNSFSTTSGMNNNNNSTTTTSSAISSTPSTSTSNSVTPPPPTPLATEPPLTSLLTASSLALASPSATLCFHARNIPAISIEAYLLRILKYCPTTNEVFLSLLVYFDRMARVGLEAQRIGLVGSNLNGGNGSGTSGNGNGNGNGVRSAVNGGNEGPPRLFAIDSFNVHRLVIAGVTVASKFFSDVFYTNSRYAKVGGLPLNELNQLELQFLLLNDFRLVIPIDELQRYADQLILFWIGRNGGNHNIPHPSGESVAPPPASSSSSTTTPASTKTFSTTTMNSNSHHIPSTPTPALTASAVALQSQQQQNAASTSSPSSHHSNTSHLTYNHPYASHQNNLNSTPSQGPTSTDNQNRRPGSIRSQPSSSGTSVTSTITPGTPSTPRGGTETDEGEDSNTSEREVEGDSEEGGERRDDRMDED